MAPYLLVFFAIAGLDFVYAEYTKATAGRKPLPASLLAGLIILLSGFVTTSHVDNKWLLLPAAAGAFVGTWLSVRRKPSTPA